MECGSPDDLSRLSRIFDAATDHLGLERILVRIGLDPNNVTYNALLDRVLETVLTNLTLANMLALIGALFFVATLLMQTMVRLRVANMVGCTFFVASGVLSGNIATLVLYLLLLPINAVRLRQMLRLIKKAHAMAQGDTSIDWLRPFMNERRYRRGDKLFKKGDAASEMFLTMTGRFLVKEINVELPPGRLMGELGFLTPNRQRTATVECIQDGQVLAITYDKLLEIYFQNPQFGYYFLMLTSQRLLENISRLEAVSTQSEAQGRARLRMNVNEERQHNQEDREYLKEGERPGEETVHKWEDAGALYSHVGDREALSSQETRAI